MSGEKRSFLIAMKRRKKSSWTKPNSMCPGCCPRIGATAHFSGSLTTPPCSKDVTWFVLKHPTTVSAGEIVRFSRLYRNDARPTQPLYDRVTLESQ